MTSNVLRLLKCYWRLLFLFLVPIVLLPIPLIFQTISARCAYIVLILIIYWISEVVPYAVTSLFPLAFFPMAGILPADQVGLNYFKDISSMFIGSMILAQAMQHVGLHRRLALIVLRYVGTSILWSMAGLLSVTTFLSMWINNSAAANIMIPTALAIVAELEHTQQGTNDSLDEIEEKNISSIKKLNTSQIRSGFLIAVAYGSAIGGMMTLVGTGPNIFIKGFTDQYYSNGNIEFQISFFNFLLYAFPIGFTLLVLCWLWLQLLYNRSNLCRYEKTANLKLQEEYNQLGPISYQECVIIVLFLIVVILWITRDFSTSPGWNIIFRKNNVSDGTIAILIGCLPLILPNQNPFQSLSSVQPSVYHPILTWSQFSKSFPLGVFMLQGAGLAIADAFKASDLSTTIASFLQFIIQAPHAVIIFVVIIISAVFTEFTSNLACASILFPILDSVAKSANIHPAKLILPSCMSVSLSFMLPIATPPNAMIFVSGNMKTRELIKAGLGLKILGIIIIFAISLVLITPIYHLPNTVSSSNITLLTNGTYG